jgi:protein MpaA
MTRLRALVAVALLAVGVATVPATTAAATPALPLTASASVRPPYSATPPAGIRCAAVARGAVTYSCSLGRSVDGRTIVAQRQGNSSAARVLVVQGQMHGEEWPGPLVVDALRALPTPVGATYQIWTVRTINPDGARIGRRWNSHHVDLNSNFPDKFRRTSTSGRRAGSEPETQAVLRFLSWVAPDLVISLHGFSTSVDTTGGGRRAAWARAFSALTTITPAKPVLCGGPCHGNMTDWYTRTSRTHGVAFTVELPRTSARTHTCAVPGRPAVATTIQCAAWAAEHLAARLPA